MKTEGEMCFVGRKQGLGGEANVNKGIHVCNVIMKPVVLQAN